MTPSSPSDAHDLWRHLRAYALQAHGFGKLLAPLTRRDAGRPIPQDSARLKERLNTGA
jgi:hypothetical protein